MAKTLALDWREAIGKHIFELYFADKAYYKLGNLYHLVEDADHRFGNIDIVFGHFSRFSQLFTTPHTPCDVPCLEPMLIG